MRLLFFEILTIASVQSAVYDRYDPRNQYSSNFDMYDDGYLEHRTSQDPYGDRYNTDYNSQYPNTGYPNSQYPSSGYPNSQYPNTGAGQYPSSGYGNSQYPNTGYANQYPASVYPTNNYAGGQYGAGLDNYDPYGTGTGTACVNRTPQNRIEMDMVMGVWYGVEYIQHLTGDARVFIDRYNCIVVHIAEMREDRDNYNGDYYHVDRLNSEWNREYRNIRLVWTEDNKVVEYPLYFRNDSVGVWKALSGQNGSLTTDARYGYKQFYGTVQVLKAVGDHLLLNFCQEQSYDRPAQLFSILLSRNPQQLRRWEIESAHSLLQHKKLSTASRRLVCGNNASTGRASLLVSILALILACGLKLLQ